MEITRTRMLRIRMGDYESFETSATVRVTPADLGVTPDRWEGLSPAERAQFVGLMHGVLTENLDLAMADDIADAQALSGDRKSFIHKIPTEKD